MGQQLSLEIKEEVYRQLQQQAMAVGLSVDDWVVAKLDSLALDNEPQELLNSQDEEMQENEYSNALSLSSLNNCYSEDELIYDLSLIKEYNKS